MPDQKKEINITVELDSENIPENIIWNATDDPEGDEAVCRAMILSLWVTTVKIPFGSIFGPVK
jgi:hypothetical protein